MSVNDNLKGVMGIRGLGGERLAAAFYALCTNIQKVLFGTNGEKSRVFVVCFLPTSCQKNMFLVDAWPINLRHTSPTEV